MTEYEIKLPSELVSSLMSEGNGFAQLLTGVLNQVLEAQATEQIGAEPYERSERRGGYRNGMRPRTLYTRVGPLTLRVPQFCDGFFRPRFSDATRGQNRPLSLASWRWW